ncbi:unnamed protein product [Cylindrotheca closterium]|uniref:proteasome endopeptidase complex n=1 Tax=Cylindrotheca closterium TaxID=2856 RepID=A0AAD2FU25_9STRA|nr:unnamed protein product [Cylindrotheca closterium]
MGVPKFFRWMSERYPKINQRLGSPPNPETSQRYFDKPPPDAFEHPDPFSKCGLPPEIDRLYIDMNGIIHGCSHNNSSNVDDDGEGFDTVSRISNPDIFRNVCYYLDRIIGDMVQPQQVVYMAIDGVAPRAKLNQQRSRRYRSGTEGSIETSIYDAHEKAMQEQEEKREQEQIEEDDAFSVEDGYSFAFNEENVKDDSKARLDVEEVTPGRFTGKFETQTQELDGDKEAFHSNVITPGTPFFTDFTQHLEHFVKYKMSTDPKWKDLTIIFSGPNVPGEGEHKIMQFIREQKKEPNYNPNLRHCIMGQDGDLIMLGLATHEPNLVLLRERVIFNMVQQQLRHAASSGLDAYVNNAHFELLHMGVLRNYLAYEFETSDVMQEAPWDLEHTIDDFVFMTFFVGNDFLPHMPALDIADNAFDLLFWTYKESRKQWLKEDPKMPYLTNRGSIVSGRRVEEFCSALGSHEVSYYDKKKITAPKENRRLRKQYKKLGMATTVPNETVIESKEQADRAAYRAMLQNVGEKEAEADTETFSPVVSGEVSFRSSEEFIEEGLISQMGSILQNSISHEGGEDGEHGSSLDDQDLKGRYYYDKFQITPYDQEKHHALRKAYMEGLVWNLKYYYEGCVSWDWYYPYHYGPMLSDLVDLDNILGEVDFEGKMGSPLKPFQQLMGCMPPSQSHHLPEPFRWLMTDENSPIIDFYPKSFYVDMNGKRWPWEAVTLLPFIDSQRLIAEYDKIDESLLSEDERRRNLTGSIVVMMYDEGHAEAIPAIGVNEGFRAIDESKVISVPFEISDWSYSLEDKAVLEPVLHPGVEVPLPGFSSLRDAPIQSLWRRRNGLNVFGGRSRYLTACLEVSSFMPPLPPVEDLAPKLIGTSIFVNYPHFVEGLVTAVSDEHTVVRGRKKPRRWTEKESEKWRIQREGITRCLEVGEGYTGTGGVIIPDDQAVTLSVRPLEGISTLKNGMTVKSYAKFEVEVPIISTFWNPKSADARLNDIPARLEKNAFDVAGPLQAAQKSQQKPKNGRRRKKLFPPKGNSTAEFSEGMEINKVAKAHFSTSAFSSLGAIQRPTTIGRTGFGFRHASHNLARRNYSSISSLMPVQNSSQQGMKFEQVLPERQLIGLKTSPRTTIRPLVGRTANPRGRMLAVGFIAASFLFQFGEAVSWFGGSATETRSVSPSFAARQLSTSSQCVFDIRGGVEEMDFEIDSVPPLEFAHGTTTLSFIFQGGIVAAVDSRASLGSFVGSKTTQKVLPVNSHILGTMAGGAADCMFWIGKLRAEAMLHELKEGCRMSVARASRLLSNSLYENRALDLSVGTMIMGFDPEDGPPRIFYVDNTGVRIKGDLFAVGSGGTFALGILDNERRYSMTEDEAIELGIKAIRHATFRDAYSGGFINVFLITHDGWRKVYTEDLAGNMSSGEKLAEQIQ